MKDIVITYETLFDILRKEKFNAELQNLNKEFFKDVIKYLNEKKAILESQKKKTSIFTSSETQKTQKQTENIKKILKEIYERREAKILQLSLFSSRNNDPNPKFAEMLKEEEKLFKNLLETLNQYRKGILYNLIELKNPEIEEEKPKELKTEKKEFIKLIRFKQPVPKFVGTDLNIYGPFEEEEIAALPSEMTELLIKRKKAEIISTK